MDLYATMGNPRKGGKKKGSDLLSARDQIQDDIMTEACWLCYFYFGGVGCINPLSKGVALCIGEICCLAGTCKSTGPCEDDGCLALTNKCCCALFFAECPPSNTPGIGCGPLLCAGNLDDARRGGLDGRELEEYDMLKSTCWVPACYCMGCGCNSPGGSDACCLLEGKICCCWAQVETDTCCDDGWIESTNKCCCCVGDCSVPAGRTPGCIVCHQTLCGRNMGGGGQE